MRKSSIKRGFADGALHNENRLLSFLLFLFIDSVDGALFVAPVLGFHPCGRRNGDIWRHSLLCCLGFECVGMGCLLYANERQKEGEPFLGGRSWVASCDFVSAGVVGGATTFVKLEYVQPRYSDDVSALTDAEE